MTGSIAVFSQAVVTELPLRLMIFIGRAAGDMAKEAQVY